MNTINPESIFKSKTQEWTTQQLAFVARSGIACPKALIALYDWSHGYVTATVAAKPATPRARTPASRTNGVAPAGKGKLTIGAILGVITEQPDGIHDTAMRQVLVDEFKARPAVIGTLLARMKKPTKDRAALIKQRGDLWFLKSARQPRAGKDTAADKTIGERRTRRARGTNGATAGIPAPAENQPQAANAG